MGPTSSSEGNGGQAKQVTAEDVVLGPVYCDARGLRALVHNFVAGVGLTPHMIRRIGYYPNNPDFIRIRFLNVEYAQKFVSLVAFSGTTAGVRAPIAVMADEWSRHAAAITDARSPSWLA